MSSSHKLRLSDRADVDLDGILRHTLETWGPDQLDEYAATFDRAFERLESFPGIGRPRNDIRLGLRALPVGEHLILDELRGDEVVIARILHQKMDIRAQFRP